MFFNLTVSDNYAKIKKIVEFIAFEIFMVMLQGIIWVKINI